MSPDRLEHLLSLIGSSLTKKYCTSRDSICPSQRLIITIRYLATGESQQTQSFYFRVGRATVCHIIEETCCAIWKVLKKVFLRAPNDVNEWQNNIKEFDQNWNFPQCIGAIDGKHVRIEAPAKSGSSFYNYKGFYSMVLLAICDAKYCFTMGYFNLPKISEFDPKVPPVLNGDDIFSLKTWLMKPYPGKNLTVQQRVFNYRLSRACRTIENSFGILAARWRIYRSPIKAKPLKVEHIIKATVCLHNYLRLTNGAHYIPTGFVDSQSHSGIVIQEDWRKELQDQGCLLDFSKSTSKRSVFDAIAIRNTYKDYFNLCEGSLSWQMDYVQSCGHNPLKDILQQLPNN
nr:putative nuclease HARBI1 [Hydra vulgaris]